MMESKVRWLATFSKHGRIHPLFEGGSISAVGSVVNWVVGRVQSQHVGLVRTGVRIKIGRRENLRVRWLIGEERRVVVGQQVAATIPAEAVRLEAGMFRRSTQRWNRWIGRIVLVESNEAGILYTVKIHGENWTLKSYGPVVGARRPGKTWDDVNVVVDPQRIDLTIVEMRPWYHEADRVPGS